MTMMNELIYYKSVPDKNRQTHESFIFIVNLFEKSFWIKNVIQIRRSIFEIWKVK